MAICDFQFWVPFSIIITHSYLWTTTTCQQRQQIFGPDGGRWTQVWLFVLMWRDSTFCIFTVLEKNVPCSKNSKGNANVKMSNGAYFIFVIIVIIGVIVIVANIVHLATIAGMLADGVVVVVVNDTLKSVHNYLSNNVKFINYSEIIVITVKWYQLLNVTVCHAFSACVKGVSQLSFSLTNSLITSPRMVAFKVQLWVSEPSVARSRRSTSMIFELRRSRMMPMSLMLKCWGCSIDNWSTFKKNKWFFVIQIGSDTLKQWFSKSAMRTTGGPRD